MVQVVFHVVLKTDLLPVTISDDAQIFQTFQCLKSQSHVARRILGRTLFDQYDYYKLKTPVSLPDDDRPNADIVQDCLDKSNWQVVSPQRPVKALAPTLWGYYVYMIIQPKRELPHIY